MSVNPTDINTKALESAIGQAKRTLEVKEYKGTVSVDAGATVDIKINTPSGYVGLIIGIRARFTSDTQISDSYIEARVSEVVLKSNSGSQPLLNAVNGVDFKDVYIDDDVPLILRCHNAGSATFDVEYWVVVLEMEKWGDSECKMM